MELSFFTPLLVVIAIYFAIMVIVVQMKQDTSIANSVWTGGCLLIALYTFIMKGLFLPRHIIVTTMIVLWASRLVTYVYLRYRGNDPRFQTWKHAGLKALILNIAYIFGAQAFLMTIMSIPTILINTSNSALLTYLDFMGIAIWSVGYFFEAVSDYQLFIFTQDPANKGRVMRYGLWRYSRHPNYFGEVLIWWGIFLLALSVPFGLYSIITPVTITIMLLFVTGIPWVEKAMDTNPEYQEYKKKTSVFIPWFPKQ